MVVAAFVFVCISILLNLRQEVLGVADRKRRRQHAVTDGIGDLVQNLREGSWRARSQGQLYSDEADAYRAGYADLELAIQERPLDREIRDALQAVYVAWRDVQAFAHTRRAMALDDHWSAQDERRRQLEAAVARIEAAGKAMTLLHRRRRDAS